MANFDPAIAYVLANEGGYVNDPNDPGGETNFGISKRAYPDVDIKNLTVDGAKAIYRRDFWKFDKLVEQSWATKILDMCVWHGPRNGNTLVQKALVDLGKNVTVDGIWGGETIAACNKCYVQELLTELKVHDSSFCVQVVAANPKLQKDLNGFLRRAQRP